jgi:hypothetical protein
VKDSSPPPIQDHLDWPRSELSAAAGEVEAMMETDGWKALERAIDDRLRFEQRNLMNQSTIGSGEAAYERVLGKWEGMRRVRAIAEGIVKRGKEAAAEMRSAA